MSDWRERMEQQVDNLLKVGRRWHRLKDEAALKQFVLDHLDEDAQAFQDEYVRVIIEDIIHADDVRLSCVALCPPSSLRRCLRRPRGGAPRISGHALGAGADRV